MKEYILNPITTPPTVAPTPAADKPALARNLPPRQPLPTAVIDPSRPMLKLGLDVHLRRLGIVVISISTLELCDMVTQLGNLCQINILVLG